MESAVFGQELRCIREMVIDSFSRNFSLEAGRRVRWTESYSLTEGNSQKLFQQLKNLFRLILNGKKLNISFLMYLG